MFATLSSVNRSMLTLTTLAGALLEESPASFRLTPGAGEDFGDVRLHAFGRPKVATSPYGCPAEPQALFVFHTTVMRRWLSHDVLVEMEATGNLPGAEVFPAAFLVELDTLRDPDEAKACIIPMLSDLRFLDRESIEACGALVRDFSRWAADAAASKRCDEVIFAVEISLSGYEDVMFDHNGSNGLGEAASTEALEITGGCPEDDGLENVRFCGGAEGGVREQSCVICLQEFMEGAELRRVEPCLHVYHSECIETWTKRTPSCPLCRTKVGRRD